MGWRVSTRRFHRRTRVPSTVMTHSRQDFERRVFAKRKIVGDCWIWTGGTINGYGSMKWRGRSERVHRLAYACWKSPLKPGHEVHHLRRCTSKACFNPQHLKQLTKAEHRRIEKTRSVCIRGHNISLVGRYTNGQCRECVREDYQGGRR